LWPHPRLSLWLVVRYPSRTSFLYSSSFACNVPFPQDNWMSGHQLSLTADPYFTGQHPLSPNDVPSLHLQMINPASHPFFDSLRCSTGMAFTSGSCCVKLVEIVMVALVGPRSAAAWVANMARNCGHDSKAMRATATQRR
jgi:hypothetical protein